MVDAFAIDDPSSHERLLAALVSPPVSELMWRPERRLRADAWPLHLYDVLERAARDRGFAKPEIIDKQKGLFVRETGPDLELPEPR